MYPSSVLLLALASLLSFAPAPLQAAGLVLPPSIAVEALSESVPTVFSPADWSESQFTPHWSGTPLRGVEPQIVPGSFEWVRVSEVLVVPRARLLVRSTEPAAGRLRSAGFSQPFDQEGSAEILVALLPGRLGEVEVTLVRGGREEKGRIGFRFLGEGKALVDPSCSSMHVEAATERAWRDGWAYVGCRLVYGQASVHHAAVLEAYVYWSGDENQLSVSGVETASTSESVWALRLRSVPGRVDLRSKDRALQLSYRIPEKLKFGFLGLGLGPYSYAFETSGDDVHTVAPLLTLYASYLLSDSMRLVFFDAVALHSSYFTDIGLYLNSESIRAVDRRLSVNLLLGAHLLGFEAQGKNHLPFSAPQGFELIFRDLPSRNRNVSVGAFIYPLIQGRSYYNVWLRWGSPSIFAEFNYISWQEPADGNPVRSRSSGISVGFPIFRFL